MTIPITLFKTQLANLVSENTSELATQARYQLIKQAMIDYSRIRPDKVTIDISGDAGKYYLISSLTGYSDEFSRISSIQYPASAISADETPIYLEAEDWDEDYYDGATRYVFLPNHAPAATETMRIAYSGLYDWTAGSDTTTVVHSAHGFSLNDYVYQDGDDIWTAAGTNVNLLATHKVTTVTDANNFVATVLAVDVPEVDFFAVCNRAACLICQAIAAHYSRTSDSTISADSVNHPTRAEMFAARAEYYCGLWAEAMGLEGGDGAGDDAGRHNPHSEFIDWDTRPGWPIGRQFIFHDEETR